MSRIRVGVAAPIAQYQQHSGVANMWQHVLRELRGTVDARILTPGSRRARMRRPRVWLHDGHQGPIAVTAPVVAQLHEAAWADPETRAVLDPAFIAMYESSSRAAAQQADRIVTLSRSSRDQIVEAYGVDPDQVVVAPLGVDHSVFRPDAGPTQEIIAGGGGDPARPFVLFVSQLHPRKNLSVLRDAMSALVKRGFPHMLVVVGSPPMDRPDAATVARDATSELPGTTGRVLHLQGIGDDQLAALMAGASAFCLPSLMEGFGLPALEAMACGTPVVVSDRGALPEVVGEAGLIVEPRAPAVEDALTEILSDAVLAQRLRVAGIDRSRQFTWAATAAHWSRALREAATLG